MKSVLFSGVDPKLEKELRGDFLSSYLIRKRFVEVINDKIESNRKSARQKVNFEKPSWSYEQADSLGYERALYEIIALISDTSNIS